MIRRPPRSTLFPTRRSSDLYLCQHGSTPSADSAHVLRLDRKYALLPADDQVPGVSEQVLPARDRKSTRLNSSHTVISYAVFCLKKKNISHRNNIAIYTVTRR